MNNKSKIITLIVILLILPWIVWSFGPQEELDVAIFNKTVSDGSFSEHQGVTWLLNHLKYTQSDGKIYNENKDYYGVVPIKASNNDFEFRPLQKDLTDKDVIYIADTYGLTDQKEEFSGLQYNEIESITKAAYNGTTIISEFNTFSNPTPDHVREYMYELLGVRWTGWVGKYFSDLSDSNSIPGEVFKIYQDDNNTYDYEGEGFIFLNEKKQQVVILDESKTSHIKGINMTFTEQGEKFLGLKDDTSYTGWFDITEHDEETKSLADFDLTASLTENGLNQAKEYGIPEEFSAISKFSNSIYDAYYMSGSFSNISSTPFHNLAGLAKIMSGVSSVLDNQTRFYWRTYVPVMENILAKAHAVSERSDKLEELKYEHVYEKDNTRMISKTDESHMQIYTGDSFEDLFIKGVNIGIANPGKWFTEFPDKESTYRQWLEKIGDMNVNSVRVYTLMDPSFYRAFLEYNLNNPGDELWLFQNIWPEEHPENDNLLGEEYVEDFYKEIEYVVDAIHGEGKVPKRPGRAYGDYYADVSPYTISYLVGREIETYEVNQTNKLNDITSYQGDYLGVEDGTPTEVWLAKAIDYTMEYEAKKYNWQRPNAFVSWPILDPIDHTKKWQEFVGDEGIFDDEASIDIRNFQRGEDLLAGFYGSYHIYPNYPDFINHNQRYENYQDEEGTFRYGGYLEHFMEKHENFPALVAEFGIATGMGNAHYSPDGYHHGGLTEKEQGEGIIRMMDSIKKENYMGGIIFEWMDEWAKKTWTTEPFMIPYEHNVFWHNVLDPEQNYGILANEAIKPEKAYYELSTENGFERVSFRGNESYLYIDLEFDRAIDLADQSIILGIDTYDREKGQFVYRDKGLTFETGKEFLIEIKNKQDAQILVTPDYNAANMNFASKATNTGEFHPITPLINARIVREDGSVIEEVREDGSTLNYGNFQGTHNHWYKKGDDKLSIRIPWGRINLTDPTSHRVLNDDGNYAYLERDQLNTIETDGFVVSGYLIGNEEEIISDFTSEPFLWETWGEPRYQQRLKKSYDILKEHWD
ncbi:hypothetical protein [Natranaerobius trueperi]|uniref:Family 2 glycosyl transferase n=1 Tax=Natranaerobius trueperi TaxID=759412 RepID=A0A226C338_9FIRM|nr:hypothetical protein [Natranaerobius trueperi]OWZ84827.1 hypothetical protein CDO51_00005 [Natranaerobius trueperi]